MNWIILPHIDCWELTLPAIEDCLAQTIGDVRLLLIDNGSRERRVFSDPRILQWHHDPPLPSLSATWNAALRCVWEAGGTHAWVVNNDARFPPDTYSTLLDALRRTGAWFVGACNVGEAEYRKTVGGAWVPVDFDLRGGPDFSCYVISQACHRWFQFDERFIPAYHEDNDYHRRLQLAGFGDKIFGLAIPYWHLGSATIHRDPEALAWFRPQFAACQDYYREKWGGLPGYETYPIPFRDRGLGLDPGDPLNLASKCLLLGQGRGEVPVIQGGQLWANASTSST